MLKTLKKETEGERGEIDFQKVCLKIPLKKFYPEVFNPLQLNFFERGSFTFEIKIHEKKIKRQSYT